MKTKTAPNPMPIGRVALYVVTRKSDASTLVKPTKGVPRLDYSDCPEGAGETLVFTDKAFAERVARATFDQAEYLAAPVDSPRIQQYVAAHRTYAESLLAVIERVPVRA